MFKEIGSWAVKHAPTILSGVAAAGVILTAVAARRDTLKAQEELDKLSEESTTIEKGKALAKAYMRTGVVMAMTIGVIYAADKMHVGKETALAAKLGICEIVASSYKEESKKLFGEKDASKLQEAVAKDFVNKKPPTISEMAKYYAQRGAKPLCLFQETGAYFIAEQSEIELARKELCKKITYKDGYASVGDFEDLLGMEPSDMGYRDGWFRKYSNEDGEDDEVVFRYDTTLRNGIPILVVSCETQPHEGYSDRVA